MSQADINKLDLLQEEKRVKSLLKTPEGRQAIRNVTGLPAYTQEELDAIELQRGKKPTVVLLTPSHAQPQPETTSAFIKLQSRAFEYCKLVIQPGVASSVVHWVRNDLLVRVDKTKISYDFALFMDDDIVPAEDALEKLLSHKVDIIAGACTVRQDPPMPNFRIYEPSKFEFTTAAQWTDMFGVGGKMEVGGVGTGFMLISKRALDEVKEYYMRCEYERKYLHVPTDFCNQLSQWRREEYEKSGNGWWFEFVKHPLGRGEFGEDLSFCFKAREMGIPVYVDTSVRPGHVGRHPFGINDYLAWLPSSPAEHKKGRVEFTVSEDGKDMAGLGENVTEEIANAL